MPQSQTFAGTMSTLGTFAAGTFPYAAQIIPDGRTLPELTYHQPPTEITEKNKWAYSKETGQQEWALAYNRWIVETKWNPLLATRAGILNINNKRLNDEIQENVSVYYGYQDDSMLGYAASADSIHVPGQQVRTLLGHMEGTGIKIIQTIQDNICAVGLDDEIIKAKKQFGLDVELQYKLGDQLNAMAKLGAQIQPVNQGAPPQTEEEVEQVKQDFKHEYEEIQEKLTTSWYWQNQVENLLNEAHKNCLISKRASIHFTTKKGKNRVVPFAELIPSENTIFDTNSIDSFMNDQQVGGFVMYKTPAEIYAMYPDLSKDVRIAIYNRANRIGDDSAEWCSYHNSPNHTHWTHNGLVSVAVTYHKGRRDLRYQIGVDRFTGENNYYLINDNQQYPSPLETDGNGKPLMKLGYDVSGDAWSWDIHEIHVIGNAFVAKAGYMDYVIRDAFDKSVPFIPMVNWNPDMMMGMGRSWCSRLKYDQYEWDRVKRKITSMLEKNLGKNFGFYGDKTKVSVQKIVNDFREYNITVLDPTGNVGDPADSKRMGETVDLSLNQDIQYYIATLDRIERNQMAIVNATPITLGVQTNVQGKGVQERTIETASLSVLSHYTGLKNYANNVLNYAANLYRQCLDEGDVTLPISASETELVKISRGFTNSDLGIYILGDDSINRDSKDFMMGLLQAYGQNIAELNAAGLDPISLLELVNVVQSVSYNRGVKAIKSKVDKNKREIMAANAANQQAQEESQAKMIAMQKGFEAAMQQAKIEGENYRAETSALSKYMLLLQQHIQEQDLHQKEIDAQLAQMNGGGGQGQPTPQQQPQPA